jgi:tetratricopeptide (TPR) repeat protein
MEIPIKGNVREIRFASILVWLSRKRVTGVLSLSTSDFTKKVYLSQGDAVFATSTYTDDRLGIVLLKAGKISVEQYDESAEILKKSGKRQGMILVELGYLTAKDVFEGVKFQVREIIYSMFNIEDAEYEFIEGDLPSKEVITLKMSTGNLIYEGVKRIDSWTKIKNEMPDMDSVLKLSNDPLSLFQNIEFEQQDKKILSLINGKLTIKEVIENSWVSSFEALKIIYMFWSLDIVELSSSITQHVPGDTVQEESDYETIMLDDVLKPFSVEDEKHQKRVESLHARLDQIGPEELLEITDTSDNEFVKKQYYQLSKQFHPDKYFSFEDPAIKQKLAAIFDAINEAYFHLKNEKDRAEYFKNRGTGVSKKKVSKTTSNESDMAKDQFQKGVAAFKKGTLWKAVEHFKIAAEMMPKKALYWDNLAAAYARMPHQLRHAENALLTAIKLEPFNAGYYANLGIIYMKAGLKKRAHGNFKQALLIDSTNTKAQTGLQQTKE